MKTKIKQYLSGVIALVAAVVMSSSAWAGGRPDPEITAVEAQQRVDGKVEITVTFTGQESDVAGLNCVFFATNTANDASLKVVNVEQDGGLTGSGTDWTQKYLWDAATDLGEVTIDVALIAEAAPGVQLWKDGPYWATRNVGATNTTDYGYYFQWGDTTAYTYDTAKTHWVKVSDGSEFDFAGSGKNCPTFNKNHAKLFDEGFVDSTSNLVAKYDVATANVGSDWRMPIEEELAALTNNCTTELTTLDNVAGLLVKGTGDYAQRRVFLPAAGRGQDKNKYYFSEDGGYYRSATENTKLNQNGSTVYTNYCAYGIYFLKSRDVKGTIAVDVSRYDARSVRPVLKSEAVKTSTALVNLSLDCTHSIQLGVVAQRYPWNGVLDIEYKTRCVNKVVFKANDVVIGMAPGTDGQAATVSFNLNEVADGVFKNKQLKDVKITATAD